MAYLTAPDGTLILGTLERLSGRAEISGATRNPDGKYELDYSGGTEIFYDDQVTEMRDGQRVFLDEAGEEYLENELVLVEDLVELTRGICLPIIRRSRENG
jgi:hypothetical protein